ncbi:MAG: hypothetical protein D3906_01145 [Candidatus Electrothrix sp. AUS1_2]|nr:hypothetical protein [Candidatus Electrothrix sp. AUS1_2]
MVDIQEMGMEGYSLLQAEFIIKGERTMRAVLQHIYVFTAILMSAGFLCVQVQANEHPENETQQASPVTDLRGYHEFDYKLDIIEIQLAESVTD